MVGWKAELRLRNPRVSSHTKPIHKLWLRPETTVGLVISGNSDSTVLENSIIICAAYPRVAANQSLLTFAPARRCKAISCHTGELGTTAEKSDDCSPADTIWYVLRSCSLVLFVGSWRTSVFA